VVCRFYFPDLLTSHGRHPIILLYPVVKGPEGDSQVKPRPAAVAAGTFTSYALPAFALFNLAILILALF
jgi:hypothetical protein